MTAREAKALQVGDRVVFSDGVAGIVTGLLVHGITFQWDDGQKGSIAFDAMQKVSRIS